MKKRKTIKNITFIISSLSGGGAERVATNLANYFCHFGFNVHILYSFVYEQRPAYALDKRVTIIPLPEEIKCETQSYWEGKLNIIRIIRHLRKTINHLNPDIIVSFMAKTNIFAILATVGSGVSLVISERVCHDFLVERTWRVLRRMLYPFADGLVVLSRYDYEKYKYVKNKRIIFNPLVLKSAETQFNTGRDRIILAVGRLDKQKGFDLLLKAASQIDLTGWKVIILGDGQERENLASEVSKLNLSKKVIFAGWASNVEDYYKKASVFVLSSRHEGFPNALAEAMAYGCACVAFDCKTGPSDIIRPDVNGLLVENGNVAQLAGAIQKLIDDKHLRSSLAYEAQKISSELSIDSIASSWSDFFSLSSAENKRVCPFGNDDNFLRR